MTMHSSIYKNSSIKVRIPHKKEKASMPKNISGKASTYGWGEKLNKKTFSGEDFNTNDNTVAMRNEPMGTKIEITDRKSGRKVDARVNDGGPARKTKRVLDMSQGTWKKLGYKKPGLTDVDIKILEEGKGKSYTGTKSKTPKKWHHGY